MPFSVILTEKGGATQRLDFESEEITIGRVDENDICLPADVEDQVAQQT